MKKKILIVVGTRPNFIKVTQFKKEVAKFSSLEVKIVHTGQHYDSKMADVFFEQFNLIPDFFLNISPDSAIAQMAYIMMKLEELLNTTYQPDLVIVVGDVNSTLAAALVANKLNIKLAHLESGLRSFDKTMPEENNRIVTDAITDYYFVTEQSGINNLLKEGVAKNKLFFVGNTMIDSLVSFDLKIQSSTILEKLKLESKKYVLMTMHRPATVDNVVGLTKLIELIEEVTKLYKVVFPIHPRTLKNIEKEGLLYRFQNIKNIVSTEPLDYFAFQNLISNSKFILTDSGGIQEESTFVGVPCLTLRPNTERPVTCSIGTNTLIPFDIDSIKTQMNLIETDNYKKGTVPELWDGKATERIVSVLNQLLIE